MASAGWWVLLAAIGPLAGMSFISAMRTYAEISGLNGTSAGVGEAMAPLIGIWAPTFSACEIAAVFLLPFVAIRLVAGDRHSGALKLEIQHRMPVTGHIAAKMLVLLAGWLIAMLAPAIAILLWRSYGGVVYAPEIATVAFGHILNAGLTIALAAAMSSLAPHPATAAILTLSVTVATWILDFAAAVQGGWWERAAAFTPSAMVAEFQHGLVRLSATLIALILIVAGGAFAAVWMRLGFSVKRRVHESVAIAVTAAVAILLTAPIRANWDTSESRANSFSEADQRALLSIHAPIRIEVHLAPEDPRRVDLDRHAIAKLRRLLPNLEVSYVAATSTGLFEQTRESYGEIWYDIGGKKAMSRATTEEAVLETIFGLAGVTPAPESDENVFHGHPLAATPRGAAAIFYGVWPVAVIACGLFAQRKLR